MSRIADYQALFDRGFGHRGRVGYLSPGIVDETLSAQFYRMAPPGVTLVRTSLELRDVTVDEVNAAVARTKAAATELREYRPDCIVFGGSPTVAVAGPGSDKTIVDIIEKASGVRAFSAQIAAIEALKAHGAKRIAVATSFPDGVNALVKKFIENTGLEVVRIEGMEVRYQDMTMIPLKDTYELGTRCFKAAKNADALYFTAAPFPCVANIQRLEEELGTFVISSLQASLWKALTLLKIDDPIADYGKLLRDMR